MKGLGIFVIKNRRGKLIGTAAVSLVLLSLLFNIKNIFTSCQIDAEYQVTMAYRMVRGDAMFSGMWEAHQTSAFFLAFFEWIFLKVTGSATGIMLYANAVGFVCKTAVALALYATLCRYADKKAAFASLLLALNIYPKDSVLPDFANLQIWFALLLMCCLIRYLQEAVRGKGNLFWLIAGALCLCLEVLAYPSCAIVWVVCAVALWLYSPRKGRDIGLFTGVCGVCGAAYLLYFMRGEPARFWQHIYAIWSGDESHAVGIGVRAAQFGGDLLAIAMDLRYIAAAALGAAVAAYLYRKVCGERRKGGSFYYDAFLCFLAFYVIGYLFHLRYEDAGTKCHFFILYLLVECAAFVAVRYLRPEEKQIFVIGQLVGFGGFGATLLLSDLGLLPTLSYLIPNICVSTIPLIRLSEEKSLQKAGDLRRFMPVALLCAVMMFRNLVYLNGWMTAPSNFRQDSIFGVNWTARYGPLKGIVNRDGTYVADVSYAEWQQYIKPGDKVMVISYPNLTPTVYLYEDVEICADSTISTPTYSARLFQYWEENPQKYPNVVVAKYYDGNLMIGEYGEVARWLLEEFDADEVTDGTFWRYYRKR